MSSNEQNPSQQPIEFEQALASLESIVHDLEDGRLGLAEALTRYEQGVGLLRQCFDVLEKTERRIEVLSGVDAAGNPVVAPFDDESSLSLQDRGAGRQRRRSGKVGEAGPSRPTDIDSTSEPT